MSKPNAGLWIPNEILADTNLKHVEKMVLAMAFALKDGIRMSDATVAEQLGISKRSVPGVFASLISKGYLKKDGKRFTRKLLPNTQGCVLENTQGCVNEKTEYARLRNGIRKATYSNTQGCDHKVYKRIRKNKDGEDFIFEEAEISPEQRKQNLLDQHRWAIQNGLIKSK